MQSVELPVYSDCSGTFESLPDICPHRHDSKMWIQVAGTYRCIYLYHDPNFMTVLYQHLVHPVLSILYLLALFSSSQWFCLAFFYLTLLYFLLTYIFSVDLKQFLVLCLKRVFWTNHNLVSILWNVLWSNW